MCHFCVDHIDSIDYKAVNRLRRYVSDRARIDSGKKSGACAKHQRVVRRAILRARFMALLPYAPDHTRVTNNLAPRTPQGSQSSQVSDDEKAVDETLPPAQTQDSSPEDAVEAPDPALPASEPEPAGPAEQVATVSSAAVGGGESTSPAEDVIQGEGASGSGSGSS